MPVATQTSHGVFGEKNPPDLEELRELIEHVWTDATNLPEQPGCAELCEHLKNAAECLDAMIERSKKGE